MRHRRRMPDGSKKFKVVKGVENKASDLAMTCAAGGKVDHPFQIGQLAVHRMREPDARQPAFGLLPLQPKGIVLSVQNGAPVYRAASRALASLLDNTDTEFARHR